MGICIKFQLAGYNRIYLDLYFPQIKDLLGQSTISLVIFNSYVKLPEGKMSFAKKKLIEPKCNFCLNQTLVNFKQHVVN